MPLPLSPRSADVGHHFCELPPELGELIVHHHLSALDAARAAASSRYLDALSRSAPCWATLLGPHGGGGIETRAAVGCAIGKLLAPSTRGSLSLRRPLLAEALGEAPCRWSLAEIQTRADHASLAAPGATHDEGGIETPESRFFLG